MDTYPTPKKIKVKLILSKGMELDEFRCSRCDALLLKGKNLSNVMIETRCKRCKLLVINPGPDV